MSILSGLGGMLGIGSGYGDYYQNRNFQNDGTKSLADMLTAARSGAVNDAGKGLVNGGSLSDALKNLNPDQAAALAASPIYGQSVAQNETLNDPVLAGLFGKGGQLSSAEDEASTLAGQGFKLQPQDVEAYGEASGNIARMFGQNDQSLASALADRGLAAAPSGAAAASFTGSLGNKNEQLGQMQMQIAQQRYHDNMSRLAQTRDFISSLGGLGKSAENSNFANTLNANNARTGQAEALSNAQRSDFQTAESDRMASMASQQGAKQQNLGDALSNGIFQGVQGGANSAAGGLVGGLGLPQQTKEQQAGVGGGAGPSGYSVGKSTGMYGGGLYSGRGY